MDLWMFGMSGVEVILWIIYLLSLFKVVVFIIVIVDVVIIDVVYVGVLGFLLKVFLFDDIVNVVCVVYVGDVFMFLMLIC